MTEKGLELLALDFDGVVCDGLAEYFQTAWRTYQVFWQAEGETPSEELRQQFYALRPVIEVGWEMPILIRALQLGMGDEEILEQWVAIALKITQQEKIDAVALGAKLDQIRDEWIQTDLEGWLGLHRFYPGVIEKISETLAAGIKVYIITTKEGRFVQQLLQQQGLDLEKIQIFGKENKLPKFQILKDLLSETNQEIWFVEDRLKTLETVVQQPGFQKVKLFLAGWGYNTAQARQSIRHDARIQLWSLEDFVNF